MDKTLGEEIDKILKDPYQAKEMALVLVCEVLDDLLREKQLALLKK